MDLTFKQIAFIFSLLTSISLPAQITNDTINADQLKTYVGFLASDSMKGRGNHEPELFTCATYIANEFEKIGLQKPLSSQSYYQPFPAKAYNKPSSSGNFNNDVLFNIVGFLPGRSKPEEIVIFSAHYDHVGFDSMRGKDKIFNGANDNASGTAAMLALANYFSLRNDNERTLVFCAFAGEELGLVGSKFFVGTNNLRGLKAVINIEMIGRPAVGKKAFFITGSNRSSFATIIGKNLPKKWVRITREPSSYKELFMRSDNYAFAEHGYVAHTIMASDDDDGCYHETCDEVKRIDFNNMTDIVKAIAVSCATIISGEQTPTVTNSKDWR